MNKGLIIILIGIVAISFSGMCLSQEDILGEILQEENTEDMVTYSYGKVVAKDENLGKITILERDWESDAEINITYSINPNIELENITSWKEIPVGSEVDIAYTVDKSGQRIAKYIKVYDISEEIIEEELYVE